MIKRIVQWSTATLPPNFLKLVLVGAISFWVLERCFYTLLQLEFGQLPDDFQQVSGPRVWLICCLVGWAAWRAYMINPSYKRSYLAWLQTTPWAPGKPLPLGRIELAPQDALWLAAAVIAFGYWPISLYVPLAFLIPYALMLTLVNNVRKHYVPAGTAMGLLAMLPWLGMTTKQPGAVLVCAIAATAATEWGWRRTLRDYPWEAAPSSQFQYDVTKNQEADASCACWPLVHPWRGTTIAPLIDWRGTLLLATFFSWFAATAALTINAVELYDAGRFNRPAVDVAHRALPLVAGGVGVIAGLMRLYRYAIWCAWPISLRGRMSTGRLIIPEYDKIFVAKLMAIAAGVLLPQILLPLGFPAAATAFVTMFAIVLAAAGLGPTLTTWSLTGEYRMLTHEPLDKHRSRRGAAT